MIKIKYHHHERRTVRAQALWRQMVKEYNGGKSAQMIADSYVNPKTGKNYTRAHVYWVLKKMSKIVTY